MKRPTLFPRVNDMVLKEERALPFGIDLFLIVNRANPVPARLSNIA